MNYRLNTNPDSAAFGHVGEGIGNGTHHEAGLTKREYFAAAALQGLIAGDPKNKATVYVLANCAVRFSDRMIAELNKEKP